MDGACKPEASHHAHKQHHHAAHHGGGDFDQQVEAARDAWAAWKSHDPAAWDAALDLRDRISGKAWRHAMHQIDQEEAAQKREAKVHLPAVTIHGDEHVALGGTSSRLPSGGNYYDGSQVSGYYGSSHPEPSYRNRTYVEQQSATSYGYQSDNYYSRPNPVKQVYRQVDEDYTIDRVYVAPQPRYYPQNDAYQYGGRSYYPSVDSSYYPQQSGYYSDQSYRYYPQNNQRYYPDQGNGYYPQYTGSYYGGGWGNQGYGGSYGYGRQNIGSWLAPVIGSSAGALIDNHNRWRGTVIGGAIGTALGAVIQSATNGGYGTGYGGYGTGYGGYGVYY